MIAKTILALTGIAAVLVGATAGATERWSLESGWTLVRQFEAQRAAMQDDTKSDADRAEAKRWIAEHRADVGDFADWLDHRGTNEKVESALAGVATGGFIAASIFFAPTLLASVALGAGAGATATLAKNLSTRGNADHAQAAELRTEVGDSLDRMLALEDAREDIAAVEADLPRIDAELKAVARELGANAARRAATRGGASSLPPSSSPATQNAGMHH